MNLQKSKNMIRLSILLILIITLNQSCKNEIRNSEKELNTQVLQEIPKEDVKTLEGIAQLAAAELLLEHFENDKITTEIHSINEGTDKVKSIWLFRNTKNDVRIDFTSKDSTRVYRVTSFGNKNIHYSETGVKPGMTAKKLNILNNHPIEFYGFEWDYAGVVNFNNGSLENKNLFIYLKTDQKYDKSFVGDNPHSYQEAEAAELDLYIDKIIFQPHGADQI